MSTKYLSAGERRQLTIETVVTLAGVQNPSDITTAAIAEWMLTQGALFRHFPSKDAIWEAVMEWVADRLLDRTNGGGECVVPIDARSMFPGHVGLSSPHPAFREW